MSILITLDKLFLNAFKVIDTNNHLMSINIPLMLSTIEYLELTKTPFSEEEDSIALGLSASLCAIAHIKA